MVLSPVRLGLSTLVALTCLVSSPLTGVTQPQKPAPPSGPAAPIPGGPKVVQLPDLVISKLTSTKGFGCGPTGYTIELTVTVKNMGAAPAIKPAGGAYWAGIGVNEAGPWPKEQSLLGGPAQLAPGQSVTLKGVVTAHVYHPSPYVGDKGVYYRYYAKADPEGQFKEVDEQNNLKKYEQHSSAPCPGSTR